jgi:predicted phage terminase large subunit-like protein
MAATELLKRRIARASLIAFTEYIKFDYKTAGHHRLIADRLEAVERGEIDRLIIILPPRHGKSELTSKSFPAYYLGKHPKRQFIAASYNSDLATDFGRSVRNIVNQGEYRQLFPDGNLRQDSAAANRWHTEQGGAYVAAGVGTAITGRGAHVLLIDDPIKDREEADSEIIRQKVWDWYTSTAYTRLMPGGAVIIIQTRWHEDDLVGRLREAEKAGGDQWEVLHLPAIQGGEALWPEWYPLDKLERIKGAIGPRDWQALYQGNPTPEEGNFFKREMFDYYDAPPEYVRTYGASDYAVTDDAGDYTCHGVIGVDPNDDIYVLDWWRKQTESDVWVDQMLDMMEERQTLMWAEESGQIIKSLGPFIAKRQRERKIYGMREQFPSAVDKPTRARSIQARASMRPILLPRNAEWTGDLLSEMLAFPAGKHDDQVDVFSLVGRMLAALAGGVEPTPPDVPKTMQNITMNELWKDSAKRRRRR